MSGERTATPAHRLVDDADDYLTPRERRLAQLPGIISTPAALKRARNVAYQRKKRAKR